MAESGHGRQAEQCFAHIKYLKHKRQININWSISLMISLLQPSATNMLNKDRDGGGREILRGTGR